jgi:hypothetical protein
MADVSKLKKLKGRRDELGQPPTLEEASMNLTAPEVAPAPLPVPAIAEKAPAPAPAPAPVASPSPAKPKPRYDGRSARRTNRTVQFATRVTPDWDARIREIAQREGVLLVEILEKALDAYERGI